MSKPGLLIISRENLNNLKDLLVFASNSSIGKLYVRLSKEVPRTDELISKIYLISANVCPNLDVRILIKSQNPENFILIDTDEKPSENAENLLKKYKKVVLGGTFDRLHNGHKVLLNKAAEVASDMIVVGVTDKEMIIKKSLFEMIESVEVRMERVVDFVEDVSGSAKCHTEPIIDPFGPSTRIPDLEAIIVSRETLKGGDAVNKKRVENGMKELDVIIVELVEGSDEILNETKISSSSRRREDLGRLLKPVGKRGADLPYIINLNGGSASGKTTVGEYLRARDGFDVVNWDLMNSKEKSRVLEEKARLINGKVIILKSSVPLDISSEIWTVFIPPTEAIRRIVQRDNVTEEIAQEKLAAEISNKERIEKGHVVFCSLWNEKETEAQVNRAVEELLKRI